MISIKERIRLLFLLWNSKRCRWKYGSKIHTEHIGDITLNEISCRGCFSYFRSWDFRIKKRAQKGKLITKSWKLLTKNILLLLLENSLRNLMKQIRLSYQNWKGFEMFQSLQNGSRMICPQRICYSVPLVVNQLTKDLLKELSWEIFLLPPYSSIFFILIITWGITESFVWFYLKKKNDLFSYFASNIQLFYIVASIILMQ